MSSLEGKEEIDGKCHTMAPGSQCIQVLYNIKDIIVPAKQMKFKVYWKKISSNPLNLWEYMVYREMSLLLETKERIVNLNWRMLYQTLIFPP